MYHNYGDFGEQKHSIHITSFLSSRLFFIISFSSNRTHHHISSHAAHCAFFTISILQKFITCRVFPLESKENDTLNTSIEILSINDNKFYLIAYTNFSLYDTERNAEMHKFVLN